MNIDASATPSSSRTLPKTPGLRAISPSATAILGTRSSSDSTGVTSKYITPPLRMLNQHFGPAMRQDHFDQSNPPIWELKVKIVSHINSEMSWSSIMLEPHSSTITQCSDSSHNYIRIRKGLKKCLQTHFVKY